jgi:putative ABC transport system substrate-binding protein
METDRTAARRKFLLALGAGAVWQPLQGFAQAAGPMPIVGFLALSVEGRADRLREGLRKLGYVEGRNIRLEERAAGDRYARLAEIAEEFVRLKVHVIVAVGTTATVVASKATSTIPIVMLAGVDPVKEGLAASLARPGGNVTGVTTIVQEIVPKRLQLAKEAMPGLSRVGILWNPDSRGSTNSLSQAREAAKALKLQLQVVEARSAGDFDKAFETLARSGTRIFLWLPTGMFQANPKQLLDSAARHRVAGVFSSRQWAENGGLIAYGPDSFESDRHVAQYVDRILKGARPGELPIEQPTKLDLVVNLKAAKALDVTIPSSILVRADRVIE